MRLVDSVGGLTAPARSCSWPRERIPGFCTGGNVDQEAIDRYSATGIVVAEWDCAPIGGDDVAPDRPETARP